MKTKSKIDVIEYKKQCDLVVKLKKGCKKGIFDNLEIKSNSKPLGLIFKSYLSKKYAKSDADIILIEHNQTLLDNSKVTNVFNAIII